MFALYVYGNVCIFFNELVFFNGSEGKLGNFQSGSRAPVAITLCVHSVLQYEIQ